MPATNPTRQISAELLASIASGGSTLTACLLIEPELGDPVGFTSLDEDIEVGGQLYLADPGLSATELAGAIDYSVDNLEVTGALKSGVVTREDVHGGRFDDAPYRIIVVDFEHPEHGHMVVQRGTLGMPSTADERFTFELRSLMQKVQQPRGELTSPLCRNDIFDSRCRLDENGTHPGLGIPYKYADVLVTEALSRFSFKVQITGVAIPAGYFNAGLLVWTGGANEGQKSEVKTHTAAGDVHTITLQEPTASAFQVGDELRVRKGCLKTVDACVEVENMENQSAEAYLPGDEELIRRPGF